MNIGISLIDTLYFGRIQINSDYRETLIDHFHGKWKSYVTEPDNAEYSFFIFNRIQ
ncbi:hypothetical protein D3C74_473540 [compost metagenome]